MTMKKRYKHPRNQAQYIASLFQNRGVECRAPFSPDCVPSNISVTSLQVTADNTTQERVVRAQVEFVVKAHECDPLDGMARRGEVCVHDSASSVCGSSTSHRSPQGPICDALLAKDLRSEHDAIHVARRAGIAPEEVMAIYNNRVVDSKLSLATAHALWTDVLRPVLLIPLNPEVKALIDQDRNPSLFVPTLLDVVIHAFGRMAKPQYEFRVEDFVRMQALMIPKYQQFLEEIKEPSRNRSGPRTSSAGVGSKRSRGTSASPYWSDEDLIRALNSERRERSNDAKTP